MKFHELQTDNKTSRRRVGRGISGGQGKTAGRGTKGQSARAGGKVRPGFEGGQTPVYVHIPKLGGFTPRPRNKATVSLKQLAALKDTKVLDNESLATAGLISSPHLAVKVIGSDKLAVKLTVKVQVVTAAAREAIEAAGGTIELVERPMRAKQREKAERMASKRPARKTSETSKK